MKKITTKNQRNIIYSFIEEKIKEIGYSAKKINFDEKRNKFSLEMDSYHPIKANDGRIKIEAISSCIALKKGSYDVMKKNVFTFTILIGEIYYKDYAKKGTIDIKYLFTVHGLLKEDGVSKLKICK